MRKYRIFGVIITCVVAAVMASPIQAGSFYSSRGVGILRYFVSGPAAGMGGVGLAITSPMTINFLNPATLVTVPVTNLSANFLHENVGISGVTGDARISDTNIAGFQFVIPIQRNLANIALGVSQYSTIEYNFQADGENDGNPFKESVSGEGGINTGFFSLALRPVGNLYFGVSGLFYFGRLRNIWRVDYESSDLKDTNDEVSDTFTAGNFRVGVLYRITQNWNVAAVVTPPVTIDATREIDTKFSDFTDLPDNDIKIPVAFGFGTAYKFEDKLTVGMDVYVERWSQSNFQNQGIVNDSKRVGFGVEYLSGSSPQSGYLSRVAYRAGFYYRDLGLEDPVGHKVTEIFGSIGLGLPIRWKAGRIDLALEGGRRGSLNSNPVRETVIRVTGTVSLGERWFYRGQK